jgi:hypothetical protein
MKKYMVHEAWRGNYDFEDLFKNHGKYFIYDNDEKLQEEFVRISSCSDDSYVSKLSYDDEKEILEEYSHDEKSQWTRHHIIYKDGHYDLIITVKGRIISSIYKSTWKKLNNK